MKIILFPKSKFFAILVSLLVLTLIFAYFPLALSPFQKPKIANFQDTYSLNLNPLNHFRQSLNNCGSYSVAGVLNIFNKELVDPETIVSKIGFKIKDRMTFPIGLEWYLRDQNMNVQNANVIGLNNEEKIDFLKSELSQGKAMIVLIKMPSSPWYGLHYITILGYDEKDFYIYDSIAPRNDNSKFTIDLNGNKAGNKSLTHLELIQSWNDGNVLNYPQNYNLSVQPKNQN